MLMKRFSLRKFISTSQIICKHQSTCTQCFDQNEVSTTVNCPETNNAWKANSQLPNEKKNNLT